MRRTFISYAHNPPDREVALRLYDDLAKAGHFPWLDERDLLPGEDWASRVVEEIRECKLFLALLSHHALNRRGFVQKEQDLPRFGGRSTAWVSPLWQGDHSLPHP